jgi:glutathione synthase/RimK-type ligase-like ATP-grasp enzyme
MKRILVIGRRDAGEKNDARLLASAIAEQTGDAHVTGVYYEDIVVISENGSSDVIVHEDAKRKPIRSFDTVILVNWSHHRLYADLAHSIAVVAHRLGITVWNKELVGARSSTKVSQLASLSYEGIPIPRTIFSLTQELVEEYITSLGSPFIAKDPLASRGRNNHLCTDWDDFTRQAVEDTPYIFQEFVPNDASDIRMFVVGGKPALAIVRTSSGGTHLNNVSQGAVAHLVPLDDLPPKLIRETALVAKHFERELCGVDFMKNSSTQEYIFLEINTTPQIVNGVFAQEKAAAIAQALTR